MFFKNKKPFIYFPFLIGLSIAAGIFIGVNLSGSKQYVFSLPNSGSAGHKLNQLLNYIEEQYVDTISKKRLTEQAIEALLHNLDPHSAYIPAEELQAMNEPLEGNFDGIGIEFNILNDTIIVVSALSGGPSEAAGILAGDRIVMVNDSVLAGKGIKNSDVFRRLRGPSDTKVKIHVKRKGERQLLPFEITRGKIPLHSVDVAFMIDNETGYLKVGRFAANTADEFLKAGQKLKAQGMKQMILDLRGNPGGYLTAAIKIADHFLKADQLIVYTQGKARPKEVFKATSKGEFEDLPVALLIDEGSASASEIVAGALQDNDRGWIIGRRSYGKGLVQEQSEFPDGSGLRLTVSRYYTPSGRSIQKSYDNGVEQYFEDDIERFEHGELYSKDSIKLVDSLKYKTLKGRTVYGGGGIMADIFVPADSANLSRFYTALFYSGAIQQYALQYTDDHRKELKQFKTPEEFNQKFIVNDQMLEQLIKFARSNGLSEKPDEVRRSGTLIREQLKAYIARNLWRNEGYYKVIYPRDKTLQKAVDVLRSRVPLS